MSDLTVGTLGDISAAPSTVEASGATLAELRERVRSVIQDSEKSYITDPQIDEWLEEAQLDLAARLRLLHGSKTQADEAIGAADNTIALPADFLEAETLRIGTDDDAVLVSDDVWNSVSDAGATLENSIFRVFGSAIEVYPTPDQGASYRLRYFRKPASLRAGTKEIAKDTFTRGDSATSLGVSDSGHSWTAHALTWGLSSSKAYRASGTGVGVATILPGQANGRITANITTSPTPNRTKAGLVFRGVDGTTYLLFVLEKTGSINSLGLYKAPSFDALSYVSDGDLLDNATFAVRIDLEGDLITMYVGGVERMRHNLAGEDSTIYKTPTRAGLWIQTSATLDDGGSRFDDFYLYDLVTRPEIPEELFVRLINYGCAHAKLREGDLGEADRYMGLYEQNLPPPPTAKTRHMPGPLSLVPERGPFDLDPDSRH